MNVRKMLDEISVTEFQEWQVYARLAPFDEERMDWRFASITNTMANMWRDTKKRPSPFQLSQFVLKFGDAPSAKPEQTWQEQKQIGMMLAQAYNQSAEKKAA